MTNIAFGEWLKKELDKRDWSKSDLARKSGVSASQITRLIKGERGVRDETLDALAVALKIRPEKVFLVAIGKYTETESDAWVKDAAHKLPLVAQEYRGVLDGMIDSMIKADEAERRPKPKIKPAKV